MTHSQEPAAPPPGGGEPAPDAARVELRADDLEAAIDALAEALIVFGPDGAIRRMNEAARRFLPGDAAPGVPPSGGPPFLDEAGRPLPPEATPQGRALAGETVRAVRLTVRDTGGRPAKVSASAAPIRAPGGQVSGAVLTVSDESAIHRLQEERDDLLRAITHDLRTPLNAVYLQAHQIARGAEEAGRLAERGSSIVRSCERMSDMLQELADGALLEAGRLEVALRPVDVAALLRELLDRLEGALDVGRVRVAVAEPLPGALADPRRLERVLVNLVSNALKYSPSQSPVEVRLDAVAGEVRIEVADRGVGIAPEDQVHLFERWYRARGTRRPEGLGLGLYITRLLVEAQGGRVALESRLGEGSTFRVQLPAARAP